MTRRWLVPLAFSLLLAVVTYQGALALAPWALMRGAIARTAARGGVNRMYHVALSTDRSHTVVRPSPDLVYSVCSFDLSAGPLTIDVPTIPAPYWSLSVSDANATTAFVRNSRDSDGQPIHIVVALEQQPVPGNATVVRLSDPRGVALMRALVADRTRFAAIDRARRGAECHSVGNGAPDDQDGDPIRGRNVRSGATSRTSLHARRTRSDLMPA